MCVLDILDLFSPYITSIMEVVFLLPIICVCLFVSDVTLNIIEQF